MNEFPTQLDDIEKLYNSGRITSQQRDQMASKIAPENSANSGPIDTEAFKAAVGPSAAQAELTDPVAPLVVEESVQPDLVPEPVVAEPTPYGTPSVQYRDKTATQTERTAVPSNIQSELDRTEKLNQDLLRTKADLMVADAQAAAASKKVEAAESEAFLKRQQEKQEAVAAKSAEYQKQIDMKIADLQSQSIDSGRLWAESSTGNKILAGVSLALGALGAGLMKDGRNRAAEVIDKAIDRDIEVQKSNIAKKQQDVSSARGAYSEFLSATGSERIAELATRNLAIENVQKQLAAAQASNLPEVAKNNVQLLAADMQQKKLLNDAEINKITTKKSVEEVEMTPKAPKLLPPPTEAVMKEITDAEDSVITFNKMDAAAREYLDKYKSSPNVVELAANDFLRKFGWDNADLVELQGLSGEALTKKIKSLSGVAASEKEVARIAPILPMLTQNPKAFFMQLNRNREQSMEQATNGRKRYGEIWQLPKPAFDYDTEKSVIKYK